MKTVPCGEYLGLRVMRIGSVEGSTMRNFKSRRLRWAENVASMEDDRIALTILTDKPTRKVPLGRHRN